jgi:hypothetical protein
MQITDILSISITVLGFLLAFYIYLHDKRDKERKKLAQNVAGYHALEEEAAKLILQLRGNGSPTVQEIKKVKTELRELAVNSEANPIGARPRMTANECLKFL